MHGTSVTPELKAFSAWREQCATGSATQGDRSVRLLPEVHIVLLPI